MNFLPKIEYIPKRSSSEYVVINKNNYDEFLERIEEILIGDVWAITVDNEIIFNYYEPKSIKEKIQDNIIRHEVSQYPHLLFTNMIDQGKDGKIIFYLFGQWPWYVVINYDSGFKRFKVDYFKSYKYIEKYD